METSLPACAGHGGEARSLAASANEQDAVPYVPIWIAGGMQRKETRVAANTPEIQIGASVVDAGGRAVGRVTTVEYDHLVVERGFIFTKTYYLPFSAVSRVEGAAGHYPSRVHLSLNGKQIEETSRTDSFKEERGYIGQPVEKARYARLYPTATASLDPARHSADDISSPSNYTDPDYGGDVNQSDIARDRIKTLKDNAPDDQTIFEQAQIARRPAKPS